jgi:hypothetical protein
VRASSQFPVLSSQSMPFKYMAGEDVRKGDHVRFHGELGRVEFVAESSVDDPETAWYVKEFGGGVMILEPKVSGRAFLHETDTDEDLILISRADEALPEQLSQSGPNTEN